MDHFIPWVLEQPAFSDLIEGDLPLETSVTGWSIIVSFMVAALIGLGLVVISNFFAIAGPYILKVAIDALATASEMRVIIGYAGLLVLVALIAGVIRWIMRELLNGISRRTNRFSGGSRPGAMNSQSW